MSAKVLVVGGGGREHALAFFLARSPQVERVYTAPGNAGTPNNVPIDVRGGKDFDRLADFVRAEGIDLTVVGPEAPLCAGLADAFAAQGLPVFGPSLQAARLEGDKAFAREFMRRHGIPQPEFAVFRDRARAEAHLRRLPQAPVVVKAAGLAGGKGALVCGSREEALGALDSLMGRRVFAGAGDTVVIEEFMAGEEASILALCDGERALYLPPSQDHKRIFDGDRGPNTGGMGAYAPAPLVSVEVQRRVDAEIVRPVLAGLAAEGTPYRGCLYVGLMVEKGRPRVVEFNCRLGDPEAQAGLPLLVTDLYEALRRAACASFADLELETRSGAACAVVMAAAGYPGACEKGKEIRGLSSLEGLEDLFVFHAGTRRGERGEVLTAGGRVLGITGTGPTLQRAVRRAYEGAARVRFEGAQYRKDIAHRALGPGAES